MEQKPLDNKIRNWAVAGHLTGLLFLVGIPFGNLLGPLVIWLTMKKEHPFIEENSKEALNFQISFTIYSMVAFLLALVVIGFVFLFAIVIIELVCVIKAAINASNGETYKYPWTIRFIK